MTVPFVCWRWGTLFGPEYVNRLRSALARHVHVPHELVCVTTDRAGIHPSVRLVAPPTWGRYTPRCWRRMWQFDRARVTEFGKRFVHIDLDTVITDDITAIVTRTEPLVCWRAHYANVVSPAFMVLETGHLHELWERFDADPIGYAAETGVPNASDLAMLNHFLKDRQPPAFWDEADGFVAYFGKGYEKQAHLGIGPTTKALPAGTRVIMLGGADKTVLDEGLTPWALEHWR